MYKNLRRLTVLLFLLSVAPALPASAKKRNKTREQEKEITESTPAILWRNPGNIVARDLFYGAGGKGHQPHTRFRFIKEDDSGTNPKFVIQDENGVKWKVKLGPEAQPETAASRLVWAMGYFTDEDYVVPLLRVEGMRRLKRGQNLVSADGSMRNARLERYLKTEKRIGRWRWRQNRFSGTRELNGLRVLMALINNWDLKDGNNSIYEENPPEDSRGRELHYVVSDLGASFGSTGAGWSHGGSRGNLRAYAHSRFIRKITSRYVDFATPTRPALIYIFNPKQLTIHWRLRWIGKHVPRSDVQWISRLLGQLSPKQIREAFRAAGYPPEQVEPFAQILQERIAELNRL